MRADPAIGTQPLLAERSGISQAHVSRLLNRHAAATVDVLDALARACRCQPWELLVDDEATREQALRRILGG